MTDQTSPPEQPDLTLDPALRIMERVGWALFAVWAIALIAWAVVEPDPYAQGWRLVLELAFVGRLISVADGVSNGFSYAYLVLQNVPQDMIMLLVIYPWVVRACEHGSKRNFVGRRIDGLRKSGERHKRIVEPFGALGLLAFVFFPFWSTGALVGGVVGYLLGMRTKVVFLTVFLGHCLSVISILLFFDAMNSLAEAFESGIMKYLPWIVLCVLIGMSALQRGFVALRKKQTKHD